LDHKQFRFYTQTGSLKQIRECVAQMASGEKAEYFRGVFQMPLRPEVLEYLGSELIRLPPAQGVTLLVDLLYSEEVSSRNLAVELFSSFGEEAIHVLSHHINDLNEDVRLFVVLALTQIPSRSRVLLCLRNQLRIEKEANVQAAILEALGDLGNPVEDGSAIQDCLDKSSHPYIHFVAKRALLRLGIEADDSE
jgi:HEAT repeat protein